MKYFIFSIDDGTVYDKKVIDILNKYHFKGTFNLNSGLEDFVWYLDDMPIKRLNLFENRDLYKGHEVASHSLTHPHLTSCNGEHIVYEVGEDIDRLEKIFDYRIKTFAFPFEDFDERCIATIKYIRDIKCIRVSAINPSFLFPKDLHHIEITSLDISDAIEKMEIFKEREDGLFIFVSHSYDFEVNGTYSLLDALCQTISQNKDIKVITMSELYNIMK